MHPAYAMKGDRIAYGINIQHTSQPICVLLQRTYALAAIVTFPLVHHSVFIYIGFSMVFQDIGQLSRYADQCLLVPVTPGWNNHDIYQVGCMLHVQYSAFT